MKNSVYPSIKVDYNRDGNNALGIMPIGKKRVALTIVSLVFAVAVLWLIFRACSAGGEEGRRIFRIGRDSTWYPLDLRGKEKAMEGFAGDLIQHIGNRQGFLAVPFEVGPNALFDGLDIGNYEGVLSSLTPNVVNRKRYLFSDPFYLVGPVLVVKEGSKAQSLEDMRGKILGVESGALQVFNIQEPPDVVIIPYNTASEALESLDKNVIDGVILDALKAYVWTEGFYTGRLKVVTSPLTTRGIRLVTLKNPENVKMVSQFNAGLKEVRESGEYGRLIEKWNLINTLVNDNQQQVED